MNNQKNKTEVTIYSGLKVDFQYSLKIAGAPDVNGDGSVLIKEKNPSKEKIKETVEAYVTEKAVSHLGQATEQSLDASIVVTKTSEVSTKVAIALR